MRLRLDRVATFLVVAVVLHDAFDDFVVSPDSFLYAGMLFVAMYGGALAGYAAAELRRLGLTGSDDEDDPYDF